MKQNILFYSNGLAILNGFHDIPQTFNWLTLFECRDET